MNGFRGRTTSLWMDTTPHTTYEPLGGELRVDVCVVGGGITGLTAATLLEDAGMTVAVAEHNRVATGVSGYTTAKVTALHGLVYDRVRSSFGADGARAYAEANLAALELVADWVRERAIDCDFRRRPAITYAQEAQDADKVHAEVDAAREAGLPAELDTEVDLPWDVAAAVRLDHQAEFHPRRYLLALAAALHGNGSHVLERTRALDVHEGSPCRVETDQGVIFADHVIVATHYPVLDRGLFFARLSPERSYVLGVRARGPAPHGMFLSAESPAHSVRAHPVDGGELLIVGGEGHKTGQGGDTTEHYERLEAWARERFEIESVEYRWSAQDCMPADGIPYVGPIAPRSERVWTATGYRKWGMSNGTAAAMILADRIAGRDNPWAETFDSNRFKPVAAAPRLIKENVNVGFHFFADRFTAPDARSVDDLAPGEGGIVAHDGDRVGAYRDQDGLVHAVSPTCTHLYCEVNWNSAERSWDCPCHGSRFDVHGHVIQGPAVQDLDVVQVRAPGDDRASAG